MHKKDDFILFRRNHEIHRLWDSSIQFARILSMQSPGFSTFPAFPIDLLHWAFAFSAEPCIEVLTLNWLCPSDSWLNDDCHRQYIQKNKLV